ncbi:unnamed protein product [Peronospora destructor]|uniref:HTH psq-type domain-containing protein n=1 Tax=Peronospora destructor TaxID=86335 RepID=A0AAV0TL17_9STRA|nr:unnamed protein product [Peronospora destructor]CAI5742807.1 unnamed protein product [Peronospora destructor]
MVSSYYLGNFPTRNRDASESLIASSDYHVLIHSRQPLVRHEDRLRFSNTRIPNRGHVDRLPGVATLLRRLDTIQHSDPFVSVSDCRYDLQHRICKTESAFECWTPPSLTGRPSTITLPAFKLAPCTAALNTTESRFHPWKSTLDKVGLKTPTETMESWTEQAKPSPRVIWSSDPVRVPRDDSRSKTSRYLREIDRRRILIRIAQGEKQSALAKEYHVSRAAICNLNKHRAEVLLRNYEHPLAKHPKRRLLIKSQR